MGTSSFQAGTMVIIQGQDYELRRKFEDSQNTNEHRWQLEHVRTRRLIEHTVQALQKLYVSGELVFAQTRERKGRAIREADPQQWEAAKVRLAYVKAILDYPSSQKQVLDAINELWKKIHKPHTPPGVSTVLKWKKLYIASGRDLVSLLARNDAKGNKCQRIPTDLSGILHDLVERVYLTLEKPTLQHVVDLAQAAVEQENETRLPELKLPLPTRRSIRSIIASVPAFDRYAARNGRTAAVKRFRSVLAHRTTNAPLERAEIDHTQLDLMVIDDDNALPLGRPYVTVCIDDYTRCVLGIEIGFEPPSYLSVARCLKKAFLPKDLSTQYPRVKKTWDAHGVMRELVVDNGAEFHSVSLENACFTLGIEIHYSARKTPWFKGKVERFLGTLNDAVAHGVPGTTFRNIFEKDDYDPSKHSVIRLSTLKEIMHIWIVDVYHEKIHRTLQASPASVWRASTALHDILLPDDPAELDAILGRSEQRRLTHRGIELDGLLYNSSDLTNLRMRHGDTLDVDIRVDDSDLGRITVLSPDRQQLFKVPALRWDYANGLTRWQHRVCKKFAREQGQSNSSSGWLAAKQLIAQMIDEEFLHKKQKTRARMARFRGEGKSLPKPASPVLQAPGRVDREAHQGSASTLVLPPEVPISHADIASTEDAPIRKKKFEVIYRNREHNGIFGE